MPKQQQIVNQLHPTESRWFAVYTGFRKEKVVKELLKKKQIQAYLPLQKVTRRWQRKIKHFEIPLINCYLFVNITRAEYVKVLETEYVLNFVKFARDLYAIPDEEIYTMKRVVMDESSEAQLVATEYNERDVVEITTGNLVGLQGKLIAKEGKHRLLVELNTLGYSLQISVEENWLRKLQFATA